MNYDKTALAKHRELKGKIEVTLKVPLNSPEDLSTYYTPGVGAVSKYISVHPDEARNYTWLNNSVAVISDGSAVLGLGDIGPKAALPVMEGKAMLFKHFAGIDAVPIVLDVHDAEGIITAVKSIAPSFGAINLEDISAPKCFYIEQELKRNLNIPIMHDDQHGTAIVVLAGLINAMKVVGKNLKDCRIVIVGAGAAGTAIIKLLHLYAKPLILAVDSQGIVSSDRDDLNPEKRHLLDFTNTSNVSGNLADALENADVFIGVSRAGLLNASLIGKMARDPIIFAMANPVPEIMPSEAKLAGATIVATGRSDFPNQVNNALAFPGIFRGALDNQISSITDDHKLAVASVIAGLVKNPSADNIIPSILNKKLVSSIARVII